MELVAKTDLERHLTKGKFYRVIDRTDKEFTIINDSKVKYSYPRKAFETTAESQTKIVNETIPHTTASWTGSDPNITYGTQSTPVPTPVWVTSPWTVPDVNSFPRISLVDQDMRDMLKLRGETKAGIPTKEQVEEDRLLRLRFEQKDDSINNGGSTDYYKLNPSWKDASDIIEDRNMTFSQGNIFKAAFTFNVGRHEGTDELREINKIIYFAERRKAEILKEREND